MPSYTGLVATRCFAPTSLNTTNRQCMARNPHYARDDIVSLRLIIPNFRINNASPFQEQGVGSTATVTASVEYPLNTMTQVLFSGISAGSIPDNSMLVSDPVSVSIPNGGLFCSRIYYTSTTGVLSLGGQDVSGVGTINLGGLEAGVSGITDKTMSGTVTAADNGFTPIGIIATTTKSSFVIIGDSITFGFQDTVGDASGDFGSIARSIGPNYAYSVLAQNGDRIFSYLLSNTNRSAMFQYASHLIIAFGSNDLFGLARSAAQVLGDVQSVAALMTGQSLIGDFKRRAHPVTIIQRATSTDGYITTTNQTTDSGNGRRVTYNGLIRAGQAGLSEALEVSDTMEYIRDGGIWIAPGGIAITNDGTHPLNNGNIIIRDANAFPRRKLNFPFIEIPHGSSLDGLGSGSIFMKNPLG